MTSRRIVYLVAGVIVIVGILGGLWWHGRGGGQPAEKGRQTVGDHTISLDQQQPEDSGLSVSEGGAENLGQLSSDNGQQGPDGSGGSGDPDNADTSGFVKYDKYKNAKNALFGDITKGDGPELGKGKKATVYYKGWLTNGALIDQSPKSNDGRIQPFMFTMGAHEVIPGWEQGLYGMRAGGVRLVVVPPAAGYGSQGKGAVPPDSVLVFEIRLTKVQ